ncbi:hypothetical protein NECAME_05788 [Necator americanus]|uniref:Uncharacterized protein n=1 Tax=Necator americanus TaxID=51031 RepID=W2U0V7_NECAM|nr:hypothetical protein NECAME_05788 [Necator americanus]ETN86942.1 hypothetical protein NECAME_05788 [Necator americanus]
MALVSDQTQPGTDVVHTEIELPPPKAVMYTSWGDMIRHWPKTTLCIVSNEFCERFSYYGMRIEIGRGIKSLESGENFGFCHLDSFYN